VPNDHYVVATNELKESKLQHEATLKMKEQNEQRKIKLAEEKTQAAKIEVFVLKRLKEL